MTRPPAQSRRTRIPAVLLLFLVFFAAAPDVRADSIRVRGVEADADTLSVVFSVDDPFFEKLVDTLERGFSATLTFSAELWEHRRTWFDRLDQTAEAVYRIRYDSWSEEYVAYGLEGDIDTQASPRDLSICRPGLHRMPFSATVDLDPKKTYYVHLTVQLEPLTVEEIRELEGWLRGTWGAPDEGPPRTRGVTSGLFGLVKNLTGFGDEVARARSERFRLEDLP